jgi:hypothetical protein
VYFFSNFCTALERFLYFCTDNGKKQSVWLTGQLRGGIGSIRVYDATKKISEAEVRELLLVKFF